jgi:hypothetical protein
MTPIHRIPSRTTTELARAWRVTWSVLGLLAVFGPLACLIALSDVRVVPTGVTPDRIRLALRVRPPGPDGEVGMPGGNVVDRSLAIPGASATSASRPDPARDPAPAGTEPPAPEARPPRPDRARSPPAA